MQKIDNSLPELEDKYCSAFLSNLYKVYNATVKNSHSLESHAFCVVHLIDSKLLNTLRNSHRDFNNYTNNDMTYVALNSLVNMKLMREESRKYYLLENGYKCGLKKSNIIKYLSTYHPNSFYTCLFTFAGIITAILIA
jgi:hypothetical protein